MWSTLYPNGDNSVLSHLIKSILQNSKSSESSESEVSQMYIDGCIDYCLQYKFIKNPYKQTNIVYSWIQDQKWSCSKEYANLLKEYENELELQQQKEIERYKQHIQNYYLEFEKDSNIPIYNWILQAKEKYTNEQAVLKIAIERLQYIKTMISEF